MDSAAIGAVLLAILSGAGEGVGGKLWDGMVAMVRRPFRREAPACDRAAGAVVSPGSAELAALLQAPEDQRRAVALAEVLLARSDADPEFQQAFEAWWAQAEHVWPNSSSVSNTISGGTQQGPVLQGRDFSNVSFGVSPAPAPPDDPGLASDQ